MEIEGNRSRFWGKIRQITTKIINRAKSDGGTCMKKSLLIAVVFLLMIASVSVSDAAIGESALLNLLDEISEVSDEQLDQFSGILRSYLRNNTTIQNFSDDMGFLYENVLTDGQKEKLSNRGISVADISEEVLLLKDWEDTGDYALLVDAVASRDKEAIRSILADHGIITEKSTAYSGAGAAPTLETTQQRIDANDRFMTMEAVREVAFEDLENHWAKDDVLRLSSIGLVNGRSEKVFDPDSNITRAEFLSLLVRVLRLEEEELQIAGEFKDVDADAWYSKDVLIAAGADLARGNDEMTFAPNRRITRQEMAVMTMNALKHINEKRTEAIDLTEGFTKTFVDIDKIAPWASEAMGRLNGLGIMMGEGESIRPAGATTRAEAATVLLRLIDTAEL